MLALAGMETNVQIGLVMAAALSLLSIGLILTGAVLATARRAFFLAMGLVLLVYALDVAVSVLLQQAGWLWAEPLVLVCRLAAVGCSVALLTALTRRLRRPRPRVTEK